MKSYVQEKLLLHYLRNQKKVMDITNPLVGKIFRKYQSVLSKIIKAIK